MMKVANLTEDMMAACLGISEPTLRKYFRAELNEGKAKIDAQIANTIVAQALAGNTALLCFYAKTRMGWKETTVSEHTGEGGKPIKLEWVVVEPAAKD